MKKNILILVSFSILSLVSAQPNCFVLGPAYGIGNASIDSYGFTKNYSLVDGVPTVAYTNLMSTKIKSRGLGLLMDIYKPHARIGMDMIIPLKKSATNGFNFALAFGGYIKDRVGIMFGGSYYNNTKYYDATIPSPNHSLLEMSNDYTSSGDFYNNNFFAQALGANGMINIAFAETCVLSFDYGVYRSNMVTKKMSAPENFEWEHKYSRKMEIRFALQAEDEPIGLSIKYSTWTTRGQWVGDVEYQKNGTTETAHLNILPERKYVLNSLMFCLMIPLGNMTSTSGTITVID